MDFVNKMRSNYYEKEKNIDFIIKECDDERLIFRFYPRQSSCHSFNYEPPKTVEDIYKVYYNYAILKQYKFYDNSGWDTDIVFHAHCDECSMIDEVGEICRLLSEGKEVFDRKDGTKIQLLNREILPFGMGVSWIINKHKGNFKREVYYEFMLFDYNNKGFRFYLSEYKIKDFGEYLLECCDYMLKHGDPI